MNVPNAVPWRDIDPKKIEDLIAVLISRLHKQTQRIDGSGGDGGRDVQVPEPSGLVIYEIKSFTRRVEKAQRAQVQRSLKKAKALNPHVWHLVMPTDLTPGELTWYNDLRKAFPFMSEFTRGRTWLDGQMAKHPEIARYYIGDSNSEIIQALKEMGQEKAALGNGVADAVARARSLSVRLNEIDPHYVFQLATHSDGSVRATVMPRYVGAELDRPITVRTKLAFPQTPEGVSASERFQETLNYGVPGKVAEEYIHSISIDAPSGFGGEWSGGSLQLGGARLEGERDIDFRLITVDDSDRVLANIPMCVDTRYVGSKGGQMELIDHSGLFRVTVRTNFETKRVNINFTVVPKSGVLPMMVLPTARFWATMRPGNKFAFSVGVSQPIEFFPVDEELLPDGDEYYAFLSALAKVQQAAGVFFPIPDELTRAEEIDLRRAVRLIEGEETSGTWNEVVIDITREGVERWRAVSADNAVAFKAVQEMSLRIAGRELHLGRLENILESAQVTEWPAVAEQESDELLQLRIVPGHSASYKARLLPRHEPT